MAVLIFISEKVKMIQIAKITNKTYFRKTYTYKMFSLLASCLTKMASITVKANMLEPP